ncbi:hypothetical protein [Cellulomonas soli]|nr:hypothetical protein [Cellulomonas soli]NYI57738.1 hypothetical protein [Cellulomonas soli]
MATISAPRGRTRRRGTGMVLLVRLVLTVLVAAPFVALALLGVDDWHHVGPQAVDGVSTSTRCRYSDLGEPTACFGDFTSDDGTLTLHGVEIRLERELPHTGPATAAPAGGSWVALGAGGGRMVPLLVQQAGTVSLVWFIAYGLTIMGLIWLMVLWTARQVGRAFALAAGPAGPAGAARDPRVTGA